MAIRRYEEVAKEAFDNYLKRLLDMGMERLGKGGFSTVFQHPDHANVVVKVGLETPQSRAYSWLNWCQSVRNRYAPKVHYLNELDTATPTNWKRKAPPRMFIAFLEKLTPADPQVVRAFFKEHDYVFAQLEPKFWGIDADNFKFVEDKDLLAVLKTIDRIGYSDLKLENVMMRGKQIVFADPVY
jgi:hypothetical protein